MTAEAHRRVQAGFPAPIEVSRRQLPPVADWMDDGACRDLVRAGLITPDMFFPEKDHRSWAAVEEAKAICVTCPVIAECLDYALHCADIVPGVWGGTSERERRKLRYQMRHPLYGPIPE